MGEEEEEEEDEDNEEEEEDVSGEYEELLETIREAKEQNSGRLDDPLIIQFFREKLLSKPCQNQGFIVDGFPKTLEQAKDLFAGKLHELLKVFVAVCMLHINISCGILIYDKQSPFEHYTNVLPRDACSGYAWRDICHCAVSSQQQ